MSRVPGNFRAQRAYLNIVAFQGLHKIAVPVEKHSGNPEFFIVPASFIKELKQFFLRKSVNAGTHVNELNHERLLDN
jgi:hypothetical protein